MSRTKQFSKKLFQENDAKARELAKKYYSDLDIKDNPDQYGVDLFAYKNGEHVSCIEVEIKRVWKGKDFPYGTVQFPERKWKYVCQNDKPVVFFMANNNGTRALIVEGKDVVKAPLRMIPNKYVGKDEYFFQVPLDKCTFVDL
jgi:hypothetical protein